MREAHNSIDEVGNRYGRLTVVEHTGNNNRGLKLWRCSCDCGGDLIIAGFYLRQGRRVSCGCIDRRKRGHENYHWTGHGEISGSYWHRLKSGAKARNLLFEITKSEMWELFLIQERKCKLSGIDLRMCPSDADTRADLKLQTASLDRVDSTIGYVSSNVQWVHKDINMMKQSFSEEYFIRLCGLVVRTRQSSG